MFTLEKSVPGGYCTIWLLVPKSKTFGSVGLKGWVICSVTGGADAIATPIGAEPTATVLVTVLLAVLITETLLALRFVT